MNKQSPLLSAFDDGEFEIGEINRTNIALRTKHSGTSDNYLADVSALRKRLFVGRSAPQWLQAHGITVPHKLLQTTELGGGAIAVRLHRQQYLLIDGLDSAAVGDLFTLVEGRHDDILVLAYEAAELACGGPHVNALLAELCPMDLSTCAPGSWIATRLAHCEVALRRIDDPAHIRIVCTPADAQFLFSVLSRVTQERDGLIVGFEDYRDRIG